MLVICPRSRNTTSIDLDNEKKNTHHYFPCISLQFQLFRAKRFDGFPFYARPTGVWLKITAPGLVTCHNSMQELIIFVPISSGIQLKDFFHTLGFLISTLTIWHPLHANFVILHMFVESFMNNSLTHNQY